MSFLSDIINQIGKLVPTATYTTNFKTGEKNLTTSGLGSSNLINPFFSSKNAGVATPAPTSAPKASMAPFQTASPAPASNFKYQMGLSDYSHLRGQVEATLKGTPLEPYTNNFIQAANKYKVDPRVLLTIANNESSRGAKYPVDSYNPFGYLVDAPNPRFDPTKFDDSNREIARKLYGAGFSSVPHAIDALTGRFQRQPSEGYKQFYKDPTIENLQTAYNANPVERANYLKNGYNLASSYFK